MWTSHILDYKHFFAKKARKSGLRYYSFWDLHVAIQDVMGWLDYQLHEFDLTDPSSGMKVTIGIPEDEDFGKEEISFDDPNERWKIAFKK